MFTKMIIATALLAASVVHAGTLPSGWIAAGKAPADYEMQVDRSVTRDGKAAALIRSKEKPTGFGTLMQTFKADDYRGKRVMMTGWVRTENVASWAGLWFRVDTPVRSGVSFDNMQKRPIKGTTDWKKYALVLDVPKDTSDIAFGVLLDGEGAAWVDAFEFHEVSTHTPVTDLRQTESLPDAPQNLDFEKTPGKSGAPEGWTVAGATPGDYLMTVDKYAKSGKAAAVLRSKGKAHDFGTLMQSFSAVSYRGKRVRLSGWARSEDVNNWAGLWMRVDNASYEVVAFDNMEDRPIKGTTPWTRYQVVLDVGRDATDIAFGFLLAGDGAVWADDFRFEVVGEDVPVTDQHARAGGPRNLGFEE